MDLKRVQSGERVKIKAETFNAILDSTEDFLRRRGDVAGGGSAARAPNPATILIRNDTGADLPPGTPFGLSDPLVSLPDNLAQFSRSPILSAQALTVELSGKFGVALDAIRSGEIGLAAVAGLVAAYVAIDHMGDGFADADDGCLSSGKTGSARIVWGGTTGLGSSLCLLLLGEGCELPQGDTTGQIIAWDADADIPEWTVQDGVEPQHSGDMLVWDATAKQWTLLPKPSGAAVLVCTAAGQVKWLDIGAEFNVLQNVGSDIGFDEVCAI